MPCFHPVEAWRLANGDVVFAERGDVIATLNLPCGRCAGCRRERARQWATRIMYEASLNPDGNSYVTLTYDEDHVGDGSLHYSHFQRFMRRLRKAGFSSARYFVAGEYGDNEHGERCWCRVCNGLKPVPGRPHWHAILFNVVFRDLEPLPNAPSGCPLVRARSLEALWPFGFSSIGEVTFESASYVARYVMKKITGDVAAEHYQKVDRETGEVYYLEPEFCHMSLKPGIGARWFERFGSEVYPLDRVVLKGQEQRPPRYYDLLAKRAGEVDISQIKADRELRGYGKRADNTPERLEAKEKVALARLSFSRKTLK